MARSRRTPAMLVGRCSCELSGRELQSEGRDLRSAIPPCNCPLAIIQCHPKVVTLSLSGCPAIDGIASPSTSRTWPFASIAHSPFNNPLLFVIPTGAERRGGICSAPFGCPTFTVLHHSLLCHLTGKSRPAATALSFPQPSPILSSRPERRDLRCALRMPHLFRSTTPLSSRGSRTHRILISQHEQPATSKNPTQQFRSPFSSICTTSAHHPHPRDQLSGLN